MKQYLKLLRTIQEEGTYKPAAREGMPGTQSLFGYQFRHNLEAAGFPLLTTKKMYWKGVVIELLWFLKGDTNIKYLVDNGVNIWNEDAYQYYTKLCKEHNAPTRTFDEFIDAVKTQPEPQPQLSWIDYVWGDCGFQYGRVWRDWGSPTEFDKVKGIKSIKEVDQITNVIKSLRETPESRRHIITATDPAHDTDLALYWCHSMFQFNCRPLSYQERVKIYRENAYNNATLNELNGEEYVTNLMNNDKVPKYKLDCQLYQRSADVVLGVPFNIASYALLTHIIAKMCNMVPGEFIHTFGDVHIYDNHKEAVTEQLKRVPHVLPKLHLQSIDWSQDIDKVLGFIDKQGWENIFILDGYDPQPAIKAELSTGLKK